MSAQTQSRNRFQERLETGPPIVGDGGMGALFKFKDGAPFVGVPEPSGMLMLSLAAATATRRRRR